MAKDSNFSKNIRSLRKAYGLTQEMVGDMLCFAKSTIANYEAGNREPSSEIVIKMAQFFMVSVDELVLSDLSELNEITVDNSFFWKKLDIILPIITSEKAEKNIHFKKAFKYHQEFYEELHTMNFDGFVSLFDVCVDEYMEAREEVSVVAEASANLLAIFYLLLLMVKVTPIVIKNPPASLVQIAKSDSEARELIDNSNSNFIEDAQELERELYDSEITEFLDELRRVIKKSSLSYLSDYYIALQYVLGVVDNELDWNINRCIGMEMLKAFEIVGNTYAKCFFDHFVNQMRLSSQNVNDK